MKIFAFITYLGNILHTPTKNLNENFRIIIPINQVSDSSK